MKIRLLFNIGLIHFVLYRLIRYFFFHLMTKINPWCIHFFLNKICRWWIFELDKVLLFFCLVNTKQDKIHRIFFDNLEVDQIGRRDKFFSRRSFFPTSIVINANLNSPRLHPSKYQQGRSIPSVFLTEDSVSYLCVLFSLEKTSTKNSFFLRIIRIIYYWFIIKREVMSIFRRLLKGFVIQNYRRKLSAEQRFQREEQQKAAIRIQRFWSFVDRSSDEKNIHLLFFRAFRKHLKRRQLIERSRLSTGQWNEREKEHRRILSAKRASFLDQQLQQESKFIFYF